MALSNAEKVRRYRERQKAKKQEELKQPTTPSRLFQTPFFEFFPFDEQASSQYCQSLELAGIEPQFFKDDSGPEVTTLDDLSDERLDPFGELKGSSLGKAEVLIWCLINAAHGLAVWVNAYKKSEIKARIAEIEASDLSDPEAKQQAFGEVAKLMKLLEQLDKQVRWSFPTWKVADDVG